MPCVCVCVRVCDRACVFVFACAFSNLLGIVHYFHLSCFSVLGGGGG